MSSKAHTHAAKSEASGPVGSRSAVLRRQRTAWHAREDVKDNASNAAADFRQNAPAIPANPKAGHNFARIPVQSPAPVFPIQPKLKISEPNDVYEQEADRTAEQVVNARVMGQGARGRGGSGILQTKPG